MDSIDRRDAIRRIAWIGGGLLSASTVAGILGGCRAQRSMDWHPRALSYEQTQCLEHLVELIIPTTDTPGARAAGVPAFIDQMLADWYTAPEQAHFIEGLERIAVKARREHGSAFVDLGVDAQAALLRETAAASEDAGIPTIEIDAATAWGVRAHAAKPLMPVAGQPQVLTVQLRPFFVVLKELTVVGYYTSEIGAAHELQYVHTPGRHDGCAPVEELGRAWS